MYYFLHECLSVELLKLSLKMSITKKYEILNERFSHCQIDIETNYKNIHTISKETNAPYLIASFDIECDSSHGDFPNAIKDYKNLSIDLVNHYNHMI